MNKIVHTITISAVALLLAGCAGATGAPTISPGTDEYLTSIKGVWYGSAPSDADLIAYGNEACADLASGVAIPEVSVLPDTTGEVVSIESTETDKNNWHVVRFAPSMCP